MAVVVPPETFHIGWLGDKAQYNEEYGYTPTYAEANDGVFDNTNLNISVGRKTPPVPSQVVNLAPYRIAKYEVTNADYVGFLNLYKSATVKEGRLRGQELLFMQGTKITYDAGSQSWSIADDPARHPVVGVTWYGAYEFCRFFGASCPARRSGKTPHAAMSTPTIRRCRCIVTAWQQRPRGGCSLQLRGRPPRSAPRSRTSWVSTTCRQRRSGPTLGTTTIRRRSPNSDRQSASKTCRGGRCQRGILPHFINNSREAFNIDQYSAGKNSYIGFRFCDANVGQDENPSRDASSCCSAASLSARPKGAAGFADSLLRSTVERAVPAAKYV